MKESFTYRIITGSELTPPLAVELSRVFSSSYGKWSSRAPRHSGESIRLSPERYLREYSSPEFRIAVCVCGDRVVGQVIYLDVPTSRGRVAFVVQLVVDKAYRRRGIAKKMLHSIWGFSDYYAYGIVTSSPCTVEALEGATFRRGTPARISADATFLRNEIFEKIGFLQNAEWNISDQSSVVNSEFWTDRNQVQKDRSNVAGRYGKLEEGWEWIAVTFRDQPLTDLDSYSQLIASSGEFVMEAYRRMPQSRQPWAQHSQEEISRILSWIPELDVQDPICDFGAGDGRHVRALRKLGYREVHGIDIVLSEEGIASGVLEGDCRIWKGTNPYKLILCLFDVIGSFAQDEQNKEILENITNNLEPGGYAVITVANYRFGNWDDDQAVDSEKFDDLLQKVFRLSPTRIMSTTGEFFTGDFLVDSRQKLFYHKEQFDDPKFGLPGEYLVIDRRFTCEEITDWIQTVGMDVVMCHFVRAGFSDHWDERSGKEILVVTRKRCA